MKYSTIILIFKGGIKVKFKYKLINDLLINEDECIVYLEKMAIKGWRLVKVGIMFFKFERHEPEEIKYQMDYNPLTTDYLEAAALEGYHFIDNYREISFFYSTNINANELHTDESTRLMVLGNRYKYFHGFLLIGCALLIVIMNSSIWEMSLLTIRYTLGSFFLNAKLFLGYCIYMLLALMFVIDGSTLLLMKLSINRQLENKSSLKKWIKRCFAIEKLIGLILLFIMTLLIINIVIYDQAALMKIVIAIGGFEIYNYYINKKVYYEINDTLRRIKSVIAMIVVMIFIIVIQNIDFNINIKTLQPLQDGFNIKSTSTRSILVSNYVSTSYEGERLIFLENKYECLNSYVANEIFKELVCDIERDTRIPSEAEIDAAVEATGEWSINDVKYLNYLQALKKFKLVQTKYVDKCYYLGNTFVAIKDSQILLVVKKEDVKIEEILKYYLS